MEEIFKEVPNYNGIYQVSNLGVVRSTTHYLEGRKGSGKQMGRVLKQQKCSKGYLRVSLSLNKKRFQTGVHRLVAICFITNLNNKPQVNHINGIKSDNRVENLEWCNNSENQIHAIKNNLINYNYGEKHHRSKLKNHQVIKARQLFKFGAGNKELSLIYGVSQTAMSKILRNETYININ